MAKQIKQKINWLEEHLPEGLLVDAAWLEKKGYSSSLRSQYLTSGWLEQPARLVYARPTHNLPYRGPLRWQQAVISLQTILGYPLIVGGRTAIELQGYSHYLSKDEREVHLYGRKRPPNWLHKLPLKTRFIYHNDKTLFKNEPETKGLNSLDWDVAKNEGRNPTHSDFSVQPWGQWNWPLTLSTPERAILELLDELPKKESFHQADKLMEGLSNLRPRRLQKLLEDCCSVKVKRLFFFFADRHRHSWLKQIDKNKIRLGSGKRMLVKGGKLNHAYQITVPEDLDGLY